MFAGLYAKLIAWGGALAALFAVVGGIFLAGKHSQKKTDDLKLAESERRAAAKREQMRGEARKIEQAVQQMPAAKVDEELAKWDRK